MYAIDNSKKPTIQQIYEKNPNLTIAFDVDGTLIHLVGEKEDTPRYDIIAIFHFFEKQGAKMYIWSGGGIDYASRWRDKLGLNAIVISKGSIKPSIAFDDEAITLGCINIKV